MPHLQITEPVTMLTDYLLGALTVFWATRLLRHTNGVREISRALWAFGFFATSAAAFLGGSVHGFRHYFSDTAESLLWKGTLYCVGLASWAMLSAVIFACAIRKWRRLWLFISGAKFLVLAHWLTSHSDFRSVMFDYAASMLMIVMSQCRGLYPRPNRTAGWIIGGVLISLVAGLIQFARWSIHAHFNHNDIFHIVQMIGFYCLYRGGNVLRDRPPIQFEHHEDTPIIAAS